VRHSPSTHISTTQTSVYIASAPTKDFFAGAVVKDKKWENLPESFQELRLDKMDGKNLLNKLELLMAALSNSGST
jgi:mediator of RNA polymerase II transcription subunit 17